MNFKVRRVDWEYINIFRISYRTETHAETVLVELEEGGHVGRGEALGVSYRGESADSVFEQLRAVASDVGNGLTRSDLEALLPPGGARNALDCALWDLEAKRAGRRVWELAGLSEVTPVATDYTLGLDDLEATRRTAIAAARFPLLKIKLNGKEDLQRVALVREARPDAQLIVDANQAWSERQLRDFPPELARLGVSLIEQPLPMGKDDALIGFNSPVPLCADESCQTSASLPAVLGKYQYINIKLDKTGGLTEALRLARTAKEHGLRLTVGCMGGSSISMAPAFVVGQLCELADLDGPLLLKADVPHAIRYDGGRLSVPEAQLWG